MLALTLILLLMIAGCSSKEESASTTATGSAMDMTGMNAATVDVELTEWGIDLKPASAKAGMIHFMVKNTGKAPHNFGIRGNGVDEKLTKDLAPGESEMLMVTIKAGKYETYCPIGRHEEKGMKKEFKVE